ncbi:TPA: hypothetical protein ACRZ2U_003567 [Vibrio harveyi]
MITIDRVTQFIIGLCSGALLMAILGMMAAFHLSIEQKGEIKIQLREAKSELAFIKNQIKSVNEDKNITEEKRQTKLSILSKRKEQQSSYVESIEFRADHIEKQISNIFKWFLGATSIGGLLIAVINFNYKYHHCLKFFITSTRNTDKKEKRLVITNKKDRTETILCAYFLGKDDKKIEILDLSCEPQTIASFGHMTTTFECEDGLENNNLSKDYRLYVVLGDGQRMKCSPIMQWKTARGESLMALDRERRVI